MQLEDQSEVIRFLSDPSTYGATDKVEVIETHISVVFLVGDRAFKLKRAVKLPYADFSTPDLRRHYCQRELELNGRAAPEIYRAIRRITRSRDGRLVFEGSGEPVDFVVEMLRFDQRDLFDRMAADHRLTTAIMEETADRIIAFHKTAPIMHTEGGAANIAGVLAINEAGFQTSHVFDDAVIEALNRRFRQMLDHHATLLNQRETKGCVRLCHGDLHLRNLFFGADGPRMFDCIDFNDKIATIDTLYDLAFLLMDLWHGGEKHFANIVMNGYLDRTDEETGLALLPFFMAVRAAIRAHVTGTRIEEDGDHDGSLTASAVSYVDLASDLLKKQQPVLIALGGFSGSGKSTLAEHLAPKLGLPPGARIQESDRIRKAMFGTPPRERLPLQAYQPEVSARVYRDLVRRCIEGASGGAAVIVNAVFDRPEDRQMIEQAARDHGIVLHGFWLDVDRQTLIKRVKARPKGVSDADLDVLEKQLSKDIGVMGWTRIDASRAIEDVGRDILHSVTVNEC